MDKDAAARIQSAAARRPGSASAQTGFDRRAQSAADKREDDDDQDGGGLTRAYREPGGPCSPARLAATSAAESGEHDSMRCCHDSLLA